MHLHIAANQKFMHLKKKYVAITIHLSYNIDK